MPGPPPKPSAIRDLGPRLHRKKNKREPMIKAAMPTCPKWLDSVGKYFFKEIGAMLLNIRVMTNADKKALEILSDAYSEYRQARSVILKKGHTYESYKKDKDGNVFLSMVRVRPEVGISQNAWEKCFKGLQQFGLTPASRTKVEMLGEQKTNPLADFQNRIEKLKVVKGDKE